MQLGLINSAWFESPVRTAEGIRLTREIGFDTIDIFADPLAIDVRERRLIRETCHDTGLPVVSVVCCALGIVDFNTSVRQFHVERANRHLDFGYELGAKNLLLVLGEYIWEQEIITPQDQWAFAVDAVRSLGEYAGQLGMEIALELEPFRLCLVNSVSNMVRFLDDVGHPAVRANLDLSHLTLTHTDAREIERLRGRIAHVHCSDCDGKKHGDLPPGRGVVNFLPYFEQLRNVGFAGTISLELEYAPDPTKIVEWVREAYEATDKMMRTLGLRERVSSLAVA